jgi:streptogramin lyase
VRLTGIALVCASIARAMFGARLIIYLVHTLLIKYAPGGAYISSHKHGNDRAMGCVVDQNDKVWVTHFSRNDVGHLDKDGNWKENVQVGHGSTGVAVDGAGKVWAANYYSCTLSRIDPTLNGGIGEVDKTVEL